jgi:hypothetical protein
VTGIRSRRGFTPMVRPTICCSEYIRRNSAYLSP